MMKKKWAVLLILTAMICFVQGSICAFAETATVTKILGSKGDSVNVRKKPQGDIKFKVPFGENVDVLEEKGNWTQIEYKNKTGWIKSEYLKISVDQSNDVAQEDSASLSVSVETNILSGSCSITGSICDDDWTYYINLPSPITYQDPLDEEPITASRIYIYSTDASEIKQHIGETVTLKGSLFNYRGGGELMFESKPQIVEIHGKSESSADSDEVVTYLPKWDELSNSERYWQAARLLESLIGEIDAVWDVRTLHSGENINGFSGLGEPIDISVNDNWIEVHSLEVYIKPNKENVHINLIDTASREQIEWIYGWSGKQQDSLDISFQSYLVEAIENKANEKNKDAEKSDTADKSYTGTKSNIEADTWYIPSSDNYAFKFYNAQISSCYPSKNMYIFSYYPVCKFCHICGNLKMSAVDYENPINEMYHCNDCAATTYIRFKVDFD